MLRFGNSQPETGEIATRSRSNSNASSYGRYSPEYEDFESSVQSDEEEEDDQQMYDLFNNFRRLGTLSIGLPDLRHTMISPSAMLNALREDEEDDDGVCSYITTKTYASSIGSDGRTSVIEKTKTTRKGPGISEVQKATRDTRTGVERLKIKRTLGNKGRTFVRERRANGIESSRENLHNLNELNADEFDDEWCRTAERALIDPVLTHGREVEEEYDEDEDEEEEYELDVSPRHNALASSRSSGHAHSHSILPPLRNALRRLSDRLTDRSTLSTGSAPVTSSRSHPSRSAIGAHTQVQRRIR